MKSDKIYQSVRYLVATHDHKFKNSYIYDWESDFFSVTKTKYAYEYEVKVSRSDFFADFKKPKHLIFKGDSKNSNNCPNRFYYVCPVGLLELSDIPEIRINLLLKE